MDMNPKHIAAALIGVGILYLFMNQEKLIDSWSWFIPAGALAAAIYIIFDKLYEPGQLKTVKTPEVGPQQPFIPPDAIGFELDSNTGEPIRRQKAPPRRGY